jgi:hypothetical protein
MYLSLIWTIQMMLKKGEATGHISVIDTSRLPDERSMFWVPPFFKEYKKKRPFTKGGFQYQGSHEQLVRLAIVSPNHTNQC